jgi:hypothetical protein
VHHDGQELQQGVASARREAEEIRALLEGSVKDSKTLKTLTFIALIYLPANLIAVSVDQSPLVPRLPQRQRSFCAEQNRLYCYEWDEMNLILNNLCHSYRESSIQIYCRLILRTIVRAPNISQYPKDCGYILFSRPCLRWLRLARLCDGRMLAFWLYDVGFLEELILKESKRDSCLEIADSYTSWFVFLGCSAWLSIRIRTVMAIRGKLRQVH